MIHQLLRFMNKMDRDTRDPMEVMDEVEDVLKIKCAPITWPIGMGKEFKGVYNILPMTRLSFIRQVKATRFKKNALLKA